MLLVYVTNESNICSVNDMSFKTTNVAFRFLIFVNIIVEFPHLGKFIDDDSCKQVVEYSCDENELKIYVSD